jgi:DNA modification methylase
MAGRKKKKDMKSAGVAWSNRIVRYADVDLNQALANPLNWRIHPREQGDALEGLLDEVGILQNIIVNVRTGPEWPDGERGVETFLDGHLRATRALARGQLSWPATFVDLSPNEERLVLLSLDAITEGAKTDPENLKALLDAAVAEDAALIAFLSERADDFGLTYGGEKEIVDTPPLIDQASELMVKWDTRPGDVWLLGKHRLICGDSRSPAVVSKLMNGQQAALFATDPPYMVDYTGKGRPTTTTKDWAQVYSEANVDGSGLSADLSSALSDKQKFDFLTTTWLAWLPFLRDNAAWFIWHGVATHTMFERSLIEVGIHVHQQIVWVKPMAIMSYAKYFYRHEPALFGWKEGQAPYLRENFYSARGDNNTVWEDVFAGVEPGEVLMQIYQDSTVWEVDYEGKRSRGKSLHPTQKPIELFARPMRNHTRQGEICAEPFCGSGSQILAGEKTGRIVYACDIQPAFVAVTLERWLEATGEQPTRLELGVVVDPEGFAHV